jgi:hypothetical protein
MPRRLLEQFDNTAGGVDRTAHVLVIAQTLSTH